MGYDIDDLDRNDALVVKELMYAHELNLRLDNDEGGCYIEPDWKLLEALEQVLAYYMVYNEYQKWHQEVTLQKLTLMGQLNGEYDEPET